MATRKKDEKKPAKKLAAKPAAKKPAKDKGTDPYPRQAGGRFGASTPDHPNPGKPIGAKHWANRKVAEIARDYLDEGGDDAIRFLLTQRRNPAVLLQTIEFLTERADGKAPQVVKHGLDPDSPEGMLLAMAGQALPGQRSGGSDDKGTGGTS